MTEQIKVKENGQIKELTPAEQWDQLAFQVIYRELAPKGFKKVTGGSYKGQIIAACDGPGLPKIKVTSVQKIAAQLVRGFRERAKASILAKVKQTESILLEKEVALDNCWFWQFKKKADLNYTIAHFKGQIGKAHLIAEELNSIPIK